MEKSKDTKPNVPKLDPKWYPQHKLPKVGNGYEYDCQELPETPAYKKQEAESLKRFLASMQAT